MGVALPQWLERLGLEQGFTMDLLYNSQAIEKKKKGQHSIEIAKKNDVHIEEYGFSYKGSWFFTTPTGVNQFRPSPGVRTFRRVINHTSTLEVGEKVTVSVVN